MKIKSCEAMQLNIPFKVAFKHSLAARKEVESVLFKVESTDGKVGYGECVPRDYVTGETVQTVLEHLRQIAPQLEGKEFSDYQELYNWLKDFPKHFSFLKEKDLCVQCAAELALLDIGGQVFEQSVLNLFPEVQREEIIYSAVISAEAPEVVQKMVGQFAQMGFKQVKLKVGENLQVDQENVKISRKLLGEDASIRIDANAAWNLEEAKNALATYADMGVVSVEQPMPVSLRDDYPKLVAHLGDSMKVAVDESLCSIAEGKWLVENKGATLFNLRVSKNGGILNSLTLAKMAAENGIDCQLGAQVGETSLLSSAGRIISCLAQPFLFHEGSFGEHLLEFDLTTAPVVFGMAGKASLNPIKENYGLGVKVDPRLVSKMVG